MCLEMFAQPPKGDAVFETVLDKGNKFFVLPYEGGDDRRIATFETEDDQYVSSDGPPQRRSDLVARSLADGPVKFQIGPERTRKIVELCRAPHRFDRPGKRFEAGSIGAPNSKGVAQENDFEIDAHFQHLPDLLRLEGDHAKPFVVSPLRMPWACRTLRASRSGTRLTFICSAATVSTTRSPGARRPDAIASAIESARISGRARFVAG